MNNVNTIRNRDNGFAKQDITQYPYLSVYRIGANKIRILTSVIFEAVMTGKIIIFQKILTFLVYGRLCEFAVYITYANCYFQHHIFIKCVAKCVFRLVYSSRVYVYNACDLLEYAYATNIIQ